jgi:hypothetical protein
MSHQQNALLAERFRGGRGQRVCSTCVLCARASGLHRSAASPSLHISSVLHDLS